jgi:hypothetical protein
MKHLKLEKKYALSREEYKQVYDELNALRKLTTKDNHDLIGGHIRKLKTKLKGGNYSIWFRKVKIGSVADHDLSCPKLLRIKKQYDTIVKEERKGRKTLHVEQVNKNGFKYNTVGGLIVTPLKDIKRKHHPKFTKEYKKPYSSSNFVGVEIELTSDISGDQMSLLLCEYKLSHRIRVMSDGSIRTDASHPYSFELNIIDTEYNILNTLDQLDKIFKNDNYKFNANASCGTHVHLDMRHRDAEEMYVVLFNHLDIIAKSCLPERQNNDYCRLNTARTLEEAKDNSASNRGTRYQAINPEAVAKHGTLEIRLFEGTTDIEKVKGWVSMLLNIINKPVLKAVANV